MAIIMFMIMMFNSHWHLNILPQNHFLCIIQVDTFKVAASQQLTSAAATTILSLTLEQKKQTAK